jgi:hypothetical protein
MKFFPGTLLVFISLFSSAQRRDSIFFVSQKDSAKTMAIALHQEVTVRYVHFPSQVFLLIGANEKGVVVKKHYYDCNLGEEGNRKKMNELIKVDKDKSLSNEQKDQRYKEISFLDTVTVPWGDIDKLNVQLEGGSRLARAGAISLIIIGGVGLTIGYLTLLDGRSSGGGAVALGSLPVMAAGYYWLNKLYTRKIKMRKWKIKRPK